MSGPAQVRSSPALEAFSAALAKFAERTASALDGLDGELRRASDWLDHDRPPYWQNQLREAEDQVHQAKLELERCLMMTMAGERPACREQKAAVRQGKERVEYCREKCERVRRWQRTFGHELLENRGRIGQLRRLVEIDVPEARATLERILRRLEGYAIEHPPEHREPTPETAPASPPPAPSQAE
jgi:exonuclease VII large subunit